MSDMVKLNDPTALEAAIATAEAAARRLQRVRDAEVGTDPGEYYRQRLSVEESPNQYEDRMVATELTRALAELNYAAALLPVAMKGPHP